MLEQKVFDSLESFAQGSLSYCVKVPIWHADNGDATDGSLLFEPRPLIFTKFTKRVRPRAWKGINNKIQETLPLLGNDETAVVALENQCGRGTVHTLPDSSLVENPVFVHNTFEHC